MTATLAGAQTVEVKEKPPLYKYVSYWTFPRAHWADVDKDNATSNQKFLAPALADRTLVGYGDDENQVHYLAKGFTHNNWWQANSIAGVMKVLEAFRKGGGSSSPLLVSSTKHCDQIYIRSFYNWKAGSWEGAYGYKGTYKLKPDAPDPNGCRADAQQLLRAGGASRITSRLGILGSTSWNPANRRLIDSARSPGSDSTIRRAVRNISRASSSIDRPCLAACIRSLAFVFSSSRRIVRVGISGLRLLWLSLRSLCSSTSAKPTARQVFAAIPFNSKELFEDCVINRHRAENSPARC
jgi:hypothetical protein